MKLQFFFLSLILSSFFLITNSVLAENRVLKIGQTEGNYLHAISTPILEKAYQRIGYKVNFLPLPSKRTLHMANQGKIDGEMLRTKKILSQFKNLIPIDVPLITNSAYAITTDPNLQILTWDDLKPYRVGIINGLIAIEKQTTHLKPQKVNHFEDLFSLLLHARVDVVVVPMYNAAREISKFNKLKKLYIQTPALHSMELYHFIHKKNVHLRPALTKAIKDIKEEGLIEDAITRVLERLDLPVPNHP